MGWITFGWFFGKELTELEALRAKELSKAEPNKMVLKQIDEAIAMKKGN